MMSSAGGSRTHTCIALKAIASSRWATAPAFLFLYTILEDEQKQQ
jgi:hypothetical protein